MEIKTGKYKTRSGEVAVVLCVDAPVTYNRVIGYVIRECEEYNYASANAWCDDGRVYETITDEDDLMEYIGE